MALPSNFLDELRARTPLAAVIGRRVKLARSGRNWKGCCPFHNEKTPSFQVYEDGYHCFGCGAHGDAISFVMQTQGADFMEAVKQLAAEAGLEVPQPSAEEDAAQKRFADIASVLAAAETEYSRRLALPEGAAARAYLARRGLSAETITRFGLGWSGEGRGALASSLLRQGAGEAALAESGLLREGGNELFYQRVMFPIRDRNGRTISFGGRTLGDGQPKYVNGPETPLFSKRRALYALDLAREASRRGADVVAVEGYMDVIALHQAGFAGAVAPLGTALTEDQLQELWRLSPMPVLCFDGDAAGARAAARAAQLALPHLTPERSLKLATLPTGEDPDSLVRGHGQAAFRAVLDSARPLSEALYDLLREGTASESPEGRAGLRARLEQAAGRIGDKALAAEYRRALLDRFFASFRRGRKVVAPPIATAGRPAPGQTAAQAQLQSLRAVAAIFLGHPTLMLPVEEWWEALELPAWMEPVRNAALDWASSADVLDSARLITHLTTSRLAEEVARIMSAQSPALPACARPDASLTEAERGLESYRRLLGRPAVDGHVDEARLHYLNANDNESLERLRRLCEERIAGLEVDEDG
jgi:DNA primase